MARFNEILVGRFNRALQKVFSIKGGPPSPQLSTEIQPNVSMLWGVETRYLEGWGRFGIALGIVAGGAGTRSSFRIDNPKGSNVCAVIEKLTIIAPSGLTDSPQLSYSILSSGDQANPAIAVNSGFDNRGPQTPQLHTSGQSIAQSILGVPIWQQNLAAGASAEVIIMDDQELPLMPNSSYTIYSNVLNQGLNATIWWRERPLEASEVT
jgi:hypothetical protein